ncbi:MBL fold metallo-hydrolase [Defluviimonas aestuarii]|uniref:MBL fold metallo-hydrolase n=1 Tax=Albidovulum aestuarii TaxID=1130726 RepID=UPI00249BED37|nr:MBL fold metallo-hydrolase [Defluviimonas aestuarii]MDI3334894.1 MBL fold metallo-hydrolase [Defluviimonas aestuarii]
MLTRRTLLTAAAAAPFAPLRVWAANTLSIGDIRIDTLSDGNLMLPGNFLFGDMPQDELKVILGRYGVPADQVTPPCNVTLLRDGTNTVLFDVGAGPDFQASAGKLSEAMEAMDLTPDEVTHVLFTHAHPDHIWGLLDEFDEPVFANAEYMIGEAEFAYWTDPDTVSTIGEARTTFAVGAARRLGAIADSVRLLVDGEEPLSGIAARLTPGHTPGHMAFEIAGQTPVMVLGDCIANHHVAFERPDWLSGSDQDTALAAETRVALLDRLAADGFIISGYHLPGGGIGRAEKTDTGYRFTEEV